MIASVAKGTRASKVSNTIIDKTWPAKIFEAKETAMSDVVAGKASVHSNEEATMNESQGTSLTETNSPSYYIKIL